MMSKYAWWALALSISLHLASILSEPLLNWLSYRQIDDPELKKTERKLAAQSIDAEADDSATAQLKGVKPAQQQYVLLKPMAAQPAEKPKPARVLASPSAKVAPVSLIAKESASKVTSVQWTAASGGSASIAIQIASEMQLKMASQASEVVGVLASAASKSKRIASAALATKIDKSAAKRFPREVKIEYRYMGFPAYLQWHLEAGRYELQLDVPIPGHARRFISRGKIDKHGVMPEQFIEYRKQFETPKYDVRFDWDKTEVTLSEGSNQKVEPFAPGDQDLMSAALHLALMGGSQAKYEMALFSGRKRYPDVQFELKGEAKLKIGEQEITALLMSSRTGDRQVDFWLAPDWNNLPVRMVINFGKDGSYDLSAYNVSLDGKKVLEWVNPSLQAPGARRP